MECLTEVQCVLILFTPAFITFVFRSGFKTAAQDGGKRTASALSNLEQTPSMIPSSDSEKTRPDNTAAIFHPSPTIL